MKPRPRSFATLLILTAGCATALPAAWKVDPDFRPLPTLGYTLPTIGFNPPALTAIDPNGRMIVDAGRARLNADGGIDPSFSSPGNEARGIEIAPNGQLLGDYSGALVWLTDAGQKTSTAVTFAGTGGGGIGRMIAGYLADGRFYVVGSFTSVNGVFRPGVARIHANGTLDASFDPGTGVGSTGFVTSAAVQADGKLILGGTFSSFAGIARNQIVRLNGDGTVDLGFDTGPAIPNAYPYSIAVDAQGRLLRADAGEIRRYDTNALNPVLLTTAVYGSNPAQILGLDPRSDGSILVRGVFDRIGMRERTWIALLRENGSVDDSFDLGWLFATLPLSEIVTSRLFVESSFLYTQLPGYELLRLLPDGSVDPLFAPATAVPGRALVSAVTVDATGRTIIGGRFSHVDATARPGLARLQSDGTLDPTFAPSAGVGGEVRTITVQSDGKILAGGAFSSAGGDGRIGLARFNADGSFDSTFDAALNTGAAVNAVVVQSDGKIVFGGTFSSVGATPLARLARTLPNGMVDPGFVVTTGATGSDTVVTQVDLLAGDQLLVAGAFDAWNGTRRWGLMRLHADGSLDPAFDPNGTTAGWRVHGANVASDGTVAVSGLHMTVPDTPSVALLAASGQPLFTRSGIDANTQSASTVLSVLAESAGTILGVSDRAIALTTLDRFLSDGTKDDSLSAEFATGGPRAFAREATGNVLVAGDFVEMDGLAFAGLARLQPVSLAPRLANISTRGHIGFDENVLIAGFYIAGTEPQRVLLRGVAKHLEQFGVTGVAADVSITLYRQGEATPITSTSDWFYDWGRLPSTVPTIHNEQLVRAFERLGAFPLNVYYYYLGSRLIYYDCATLIDLPPGGYTVQMRAAIPGIGLVEVYDANGVGADRKVINLSTRGRVGTGDERLIAGFVVDKGTKRALIRAVGPGIASLIAGSLADPRIELVRQSDQMTIASNDNWGSNANAAEIATITPQVSGLLLANGSADAALLVDLPAGAYTVIVSGVGTTTGIALAEVYEVP